MTNDQSFIARAKEQIFRAQQKRALERRREKIEREKQNAEFELFMDVCRAEGLDPENNPAHRAICLRAWMLKQGEQIEELPDDWDRTESRLDF